MRSTVTNKINDHGHAQGRLLNEDRLMRTTNTTSNRLSMTVFTTVAALALGAFAANAQASSITITNASFEEPVLADGAFINGSVPGWEGSGGGTFNPSAAAHGIEAAEGNNTHFSNGGTRSQTLADLADVGTYTLTVEVGDRSDTAFPGYSVQLGYDVGGVFNPLTAVSASTPTPDNGFMTAEVTYTVAESDAGIIGKPLAIQLVSNGVQVNFDDVRLDFVATPRDRVVWLETRRFTKEQAGNAAMWGFVSCTEDYATCGTDPDAPGPRINAFAGFGLTINVRNTLPTEVSIMIPGQIGAGEPFTYSDLQAQARVSSFDHPVAGSGGTGSYSWTNLKSGTYLYQSGSYPSLQVPMGLYGALVVYEDATHAYANVSPEAESLLLFSEVDPIQNNRVDNEATTGTPTPDQTCLRLADYNNPEITVKDGYPCTVDYNPMYFLVNGQPTADLPAGKGQTALLRMLNAGLRSHTPSVVGVELGLIAEDGNLYPGQPQRQSAALLAAGKTLDALVTLPDSDITYSLFDRMPTFSNENLPNGGSLGGVVVGAGSTVQPPPLKLAMDDFYDVPEDCGGDCTTAPWSAPIDVLDNDTGLSGATVVSETSNGTVALASTGTFTYAPNPDFSGTDMFTYSATAADGQTYLAQVTLNVSFENDAPVAVADSYTNNVGSTLTVTAPGVLANDRDVDGDPLFAVDLDLNDGIALAPEGSFIASTAGASSFTYAACDRPLTAAGDCTGIQSPTVTVDLQVNTARGIALTVEDTDGAAVTDYHWTVEEDAMWHPDPTVAPDPDLGPVQSLATNFHRSHMPIVAQGDGALEFAELALDPAKHYYVSVLPKDAVSVNAAEEAIGHAVGGAQIPPGTRAVTVTVNKQPLPSAQISIFVFDDSSPTNGSVDGNEVGLGGFQVTMEDGGGRYGISAGTMSQDAFGNPLTNSLDCFGGNPPQAGVILSCPDTPENQAAGVVGEVLIKNLFPGKYGIIVSPPLKSDNTWVQTSTIEGTKVIDAWVKAGEPAFFQEFGPAGWHAFVGFVSPDKVAAEAPVGPNSVTGAVTNMHMSRPPVQTLYDSGDYKALAHTRAWVGLNSAGGTGANFAAVQAAEDGSFTISDVPDGNYQLVVWDSYLDQVIAFRNVTLPGDSNIGTVPVFQWFARSEHNVFLDENENGIWDDGEAPVAEQAVNLRWRDGTLNQSMPTDTEGFVPFDQTFPFFHWQVQEVDFARFKATGLTVTVDAGGDVSTTGNVLNPQVQNVQDCTSDEIANGTNGCSADQTTYNVYSRTEIGPVLTQGFQGFLGQTSIFDWGKAPYKKGENGGISGIVYYASTRAENNPRLAVAEPWEPGVPSATVRLYREVARPSTSLTINNAGFEEPVLADGAFINGSVPGWEGSGGGTFNPTAATHGIEAAEGNNTHFSNGGTRSQTLADLAVAGTYTLMVEVGDRSDTAFPGYSVRLGYDVGGVFNLLAEDVSTLTPVNGFVTAEVTYTVAETDVDIIGKPLAIQLVSNGVQVNFDDVRLVYGEPNGLALVAETQTDSWDNSLPEGCPGADIEDAGIVGGPVDANGLTTKCYDGIRNFNQARPAVFDGGYAFMDIPPGKYIVEVVPPAGYELVKEEDNNVGFGDTYIMAYTPLWDGAILPDAAMVAEALAADPGLAQPPCVGELREVPAVLSLFPGENVEAPFAGARKPLCDRKEVILSDQGQAAADFFLYTEAPVAGHFVGMILDDTAQEFNPKSPQFGEKWAPPFVPVSIRDHNGLEISRVYSDQWGRMNGLLPSTFTANMPSPSGYSPAMLMTCMNDPGPIVDTRPGSETLGQMIQDPQYNPAYSNFCYTFQYMPGTTTYLDTPVLPISAFASGYNPPDCAPDEFTPKIHRVDGTGDGPLTTAVGTLTIYSQGVGQVLNPAYTGPMGTEPKTIPRDFGFGTNAGTVTLTGADGVAVEVASTDVTWGDPITVNLNDAFANGIYQLAVTNENGASTTEAVTVEIRGANYANNNVIRVPADQPTIQAAVDIANPGNLILVSPGTYDENVIMWKPVRLQGAGAGSTTINGVKRPTDRIVEWRKTMDCLFGVPGATCEPNVQFGAVDALPNQLVGAAGFDTDEGAAITVVGPADDASPNSFNSGPRSRIDGFSITGGDTGGGIFVNGYAHRLEIGNNHVFGNNGSYHGGIRVGRPFLELDTDGPYAFNNRVNIHNNSITQNGGLDGAGGGLSIMTGTDRYNVSENFVCGNFSIGDGGGIGHLGLSHRGVIANNRILFNQSFDQAQTRSGGGLFIGGEVPVAGQLTKGSGNVTVDANLIQGNQAGAGHGGGIRTQFVNGRDVINTLNPNNDRATPGRWWRVDVSNNMIVNNVAGWSGAGISMQDTARSFVINNTVAHNDSTATVAAAFTTGDPNVSAAQPAGISSEVHSPSLAAAIPVQNNTAALREFSNPTLQNNIVWKNRSSHYEVIGGSAGLVPSLSGDCTGDYWDLGVLGATNEVLNPMYSILTDTTGHDASNLSGDPVFLGDYCNGGRELVAPGGPMLAIPALDEGGAAWIDVRYGPLVSGGDYHIDVTSSAAGNGIDAADAANPQDRLHFDFDGETRPLTSVDSAYVDRGADEVLDNVTYVPGAGPGTVAYSSGAFGAVLLNTPTDLVITATVSGADVTFGAAPAALAAPFALSGDTCSGTVVAAGAVCSYTVTYTPTTEGAHSGSFEVTSDASVSPQTVNLTGNGLAQIITFNAGAFGAVPVSTTENLTITATVLGDPATFSGAAITAGSDAEFAIDSQVCNTTTCTVIVSYSPTAVGENVGSLTITSNGIGSPHIVNISGSGVAQATLAFTPGDFGEVPQGATATLTIEALVTGDSVTFANPATAGITGPFAINGDTCSGNTVTDGATCSFDVTYTAGAGVETGSFTVTSNALGSPHTVALTGTGIPPGTVVFAGASLGNLDAVAGTLSLGNRGNVSSTVTLTVSVSPVTFDAVTVVNTSQPGRFQEAGAGTCEGATVAVGDTCTVVIDFNGNGNQLRTATLTVLHDGSNSPSTLSLRGR